MPRLRLCFTKTPLAAKGDKLVFIGEAPALLTLDELHLHSEADMEVLACLLLAHEEVISDASGGMNATKESEKETKKETGEEAPLALPRDRRDATVALLQHFYKTQGTPHTLRGFLLYAKAQASYLALNGLAIATLFPEPSDKSPLFRLCKAAGVPPPRSCT